MIQRVNPVRRVGLLLGEGVAMARTQPIVTVVTGLVVAAVCAVILATVGQSAAAEAGVLATIDDAGTRTIVVSDPSGQAGLRADSMAAVGGLGDVAWAIGLSPVVDVRNAGLGAAGRPVPARLLYGTLPDVLQLVGGRNAAPGEAIASRQALELLGGSEPALGVRGTGLEAPVVGAFSVSDPLGSLDGSVLVSADPGHVTADEPLRQIVVVATSVDRVGSLGRALGAVVHVEDRTQSARRDAGIAGRASYPGRAGARNQLPAAAAGRPRGRPPGHHRDARGGRRAATA